MRDKRTYMAAATVWDLLVNGEKPTVSTVVERLLETAPHAGHDRLMHDIQEASSTLDDLWRFTIDADSSEMNVEFELPIDEDEPESRKETYQLCFVLAPQLVKIECDQGDLFRPTSETRLFQFLLDRRMQSPEFQLYFRQNLLTIPLEKRLKKVMGIALQFVFSTPQKSALKGTLQAISNIYDSPTKD